MQKNGEERKRNKTEMKLKQVQYIENIYRNIGQIYCTCFNFIAVLFLFLSPPWGSVSFDFN